MLERLFIKTRNRKNRKNMINGKKKIQTKEKENDKRQFIKHGKTEEGRKDDERKKKKTFKMDK
jgi:hypothetical protein